jgi:catechol-2,3-dioxygenase
MQAYENALGIRVMEWSPSGNFLALGSYDDHLRVLGYLNWKPVGELDHQDLSVNLSRINKDAVRLHRFQRSSCTD